MELTKQERQLIQIIRGSADAKELTVTFEGGRWSVIVSKLPYGARNRVHGEGGTFDEAWSDMSPLWK